MEAHQWFKNGDHPGDDCGTFQVKGEEPFQGEGHVVRYYRDPDDHGSRVCTRCGFIMHWHGWIDKSDGGQAVCPGDLIINNENGEWEAFRKDNDVHNNEHKQFVRLKVAEFIKSGGIPYGTVRKDEEAEQTGVEEKGHPDNE